MNDPSEARASWSFPSNDGKSTFECQILASDQIGDARVLTCEVRLHGTYWNRRSLAKETFEDSAPDYEFLLPQVLIHLDRLEELKARLTDWIASTTELAVEMSTQVDQALTMTIKPDRRLISSRHRPVLSIVYKATQLEVEVISVVEATCIQMALDELSEAIRRVT